VAAAQAQRRVGHQVAHRHHADNVAVGVHDREVAEVAIDHERHGFGDLGVRSRRQDVARHALLDRRRRVDPVGNAPEQVALGDHAAERALGVEHDRRADVRFDHAAGGVADTGLGRDRDDLRRHDVGELHQIECTAVGVVMRGAASGLEVALHGLEQPRAVGSGARAVVARERDRHDVAHRDGAVADDRALDRRRHGEDRRLGRVDDRRERRDSEHPHVRDRERAALDLGLAELPGPRALGEVAGLDGDRAKALRVGLAEDGHDEAVVERDGDPDIGVGVVDVPAVDVGRWACGCSQRWAAAHDEVVDRDLLPDSASASFSSFRNARALVMSISDVT
jgi:hypothetical protein